MPAGIIAYEVRGPLHEVLTLPDGEPRAAAVADGKDLGREADGLGDTSDLRSAEQALVDVVFGRRSPEAARADLAPYSRWATASSPIGADVRRRKPDLFRWLDAVKPALGGR